MEHPDKNDNIDQDNDHQMKTINDSWLETYQNVGALWIHDNNPEHPHVILTSGLHSGTFFNTDRLIENPVLLERACLDLIRLLERTIDLTKVDRVVGPAMGAIIIAYNIALNINKSQKNSKHHCLFGYTEKENSTTSERRMTFRRFSVKPKERVLVVEDVLTTGNSVELTCKAIEQAGGVVENAIGILVNRSGSIHLNNRIITSLIKHEAPQWKQSECPLCRIGSQPLKPKEIEAWSALVTK